MYAEGSFFISCGISIVIAKNRNKSTRRMLRKLPFTKNKKSLTTTGNYFVCPITMGECKIDGVDTGWASGPKAHSWDYCKPNLTFQVDVGGKIKLQQFYGKNIA